MAALSTPGGYGLTVTAPNWRAIVKSVAARRPFANSAGLDDPELAPHRTLLELLASDSGELSQQLKARLQWILEQDHSSALLHGETEQISEVVVQRDEHSVLVPADIKNAFVGLSRQALIQNQADLTSRLASAKTSFTG